MKRRTVLKQLTMAAAVVALMPGCIQDVKKVSIALNNLKITGDDESLLAFLAETIIPQTQTPGAKEVGAHLFTLVMVDDRMDNTSRDKFLKGLRNFDSHCKTLSGVLFSEADPKQRHAVLRQLQAINSMPEDEITFFYSSTKELMIEGYLNSEYYLTKVKPYQLVPGPAFKGGIPVSSTQISA